MGILELERQVLDSVLSDTLGLEPVSGKSRYQRYDWTRRPIRRESLAKQLNLPSHMVLDKNQLFDLAAGKADATQLKRPPRVPATVFADIGKVQVLRYQKTSLLLRRRPDRLIVSSGETLLKNRIHIMAQQSKGLGYINRQIFIKFDLHKPVSMGTVRQEQVSPLRQRPRRRR